MMKKRSKKIISLILLFSLMMIPLLSPPIPMVSAWADANYAFRMKATFDNSAASDNVINMTVLLHLNAGNTDFSHILDNNQDIRIYDSDDVTLLYAGLPYAVTNTDLWIFVRAEDIDDTNADYVWIYYGYAGAAANWVTNGDNWDDEYDGVFYFQETSGDVINGLGTGKDLSIVGGVIQDDSDHYVDPDGSDWTDGTDDTFSHADDAVFDYGTDPVTITWVGIVTDGADEGKLVGKRHAGGDIPLYELAVADNTGVVKAYFRTSGAAYTIVEGTTDIFDEWTVVTGVRNVTSDNIELYINGTSDQTPATDASVNMDNDGTFNIMARSGPEAFSTGNVTMVTMYRGIINANRIMAEYLSISEQFVTYGAEEPFTSNPIPSLEEVNSTVEGTVSKLAVFWTDTQSDGLDNSTFSWNQSGSWVNDTEVLFAGNPNTGWSNTTKTLPAYPQTIGWKVYAVDVLGNWGVTAEQKLVITEDTAPQYSGVTHSTTVSGANVNFSARWTDDLDLAGFIVGTNNSGVWVNGSQVVFTGTANVSYAIITLNSTVDQVVGYRTWAVDNAGNWNNTGISVLTVTASGETSGVIGGTDEQTSIESPNQRSILSSNGILLDFHIDSDTLYWTNSSTGTNWQGPPTSLGTCDDGDRFAVKFDGTYIHIAKYVSDGVGPDDIFYMRAVGNADGTLTSDNGWEVVRQYEVADPIYLLDVGVSSEGKPFIFFSQGGLGSFVESSSTTDGTWVLDISVNVGFGSEFETRSGVIASMSDGDMLFLLASSEFAGIKSKKWTGGDTDAMDGAWSTVVAEAIEDDRAFSVVSGGAADETVHLVYLDDDGDNDIKYVWRDIDGTISTAEEVNDGGETSSTSFPVMDKMSSWFNVWWVNSDDFYVRSRQLGEWGTLANKHSDALITGDNYISVSYDALEDVSLIAYLNNPAAYEVEYVGIRISPPVAKYVIEITPTFAYTMSDLYTDDDGDRYLFDSSIFNNYGTISSDAFIPLVKLGAVAYGLQFDGVNDVISVASSDSNQMWDEFTVSSWIWLDEVGKAQTIIYKNYEYELSITSGNNLQFSVYDNNDWVTATSTTTLTAGRWYYIAGDFSFANEEVRLFVDQVEEDSQTCSFYVVGDNAVTIGAKGTVNYFDGIIDELKGFQRVLSPYDLLNEKRKQIDLPSSFNILDGEDEFGLKDNNPSLPFIYGDESQARVIEYVMGFNTFHSLSNFTMVGTVDAETFSAWDFSVFRHGVGAIEFRLKVRYVDTNDWDVTFERKYDGDSYVVLKTAEYDFSTGGSADWQFAVDAWFDSDDRFVIRFTHNSVNRSLNANGEYWDEYYFDLEDANGVSRNVQYFSPVVKMVNHLESGTADGVLNITYNQHLAIPKFLISTELLTGGISSKVFALTSAIASPISAFGEVVAPELGWVSQLASMIGATIAGILEGTQISFDSAVDYVDLTLSNNDMGDRRVASIIDVIKLWNVGGFLGTMIDEVYNSIAGMITVMTGLITWVAVFVLDTVNMFSWFFVNVIELIVAPVTLVIDMFTQGVWESPFLDFEIDFAKETVMGAGFYAIVLMMPSFSVLFYGRWFIEDGIFGMPMKLSRSIEYPVNLFMTMYKLTEFMWGKVVSLVGWLKNFIFGLGG